MNASANCSSTFETIPDILRAIHDVDSIEQVAKCCDVCSIVQGSGNPDLTGIGLFVHYCIQGVLTLLFGSWWILFRERLHKNHPDCMTSLIRMQQVFVNFNAYAVVIIIVSCSIELWGKAPSLYEMGVVPQIVIFETWVLTLNLISCVPLMTPSLQISKIKMSFYALFLAYSIATCIALYFRLVANPQLGKWHDDDQKMYQLMHYCSSTKKLPSSRSGSGFVLLFGSGPSMLWITTLLWLIVNQFQPIQKNLKKLLHLAQLHLPFLRLRETADTMTGSKQLLYYLLAMAPFLGVRIFARHHFIALESILLTFALVMFFYYMIGRVLYALSPTCQPFVLPPVQSNRIMIRSWQSVLRFFHALGPYLWLFPLCIYFVLGPLILLAAISEYREQMKDVMRNSFEDGRWGVGQTAALLAWLPLLTEAGEQMHEFYHSRMRRKKTARLPASNGGPDSPSLPAHQALPTGVATGTSSTQERSQAIATNNKNDAAVKISSASPSSEAMQSRAQDVPLQTIPQPPPSTVSPSETNERRTSQDAISVIATLEPLSSPTEASISSSVTGSTNPAGSETREFRIRKSATLRMEDGTLDNRRQQS